MSADTIGLLAYGLRPAPLGMSAGMLASGAYTSYSWDLQMERAHAGCHISSFCRNPLHPGPCKGWKHHLGLVSPGALHALEKIRHEKLDEKRKAKVKALQDAGHAVPKHLLKPIVYDPAKNKHIGAGDQITPGLGVPTKGLTPEAAKATLDAIPTKAQVGAKLDAKHAAEAAAAKPQVGDAVKHKGSWGHHIVVSHNDDGTSTLEHAGKPGQGKTKVHTADLVKLTGPEEKNALAAHETAKLAGKPTMLTVSKAGLKDGDKVFLHGTGDGTPKLVTVKKYGVGKKTTGYHFEDSEGNSVKAGGVATKHALSPAPGKSFPDTPAQKVAANLAGFEKGEQTKMDNLHKLGEAQKKANGQIDALVKVHAMASGKHVSDKQKAAMHAKATENAQLDEPKNILPEGAHQASADKIAAKLWAMKGNEAGNLMHQGDLEKALAKDIHDGVEGGHPTPVLDAARDAAVTLGQDKPGAMKALADAVHAKLGISGHDDTPAKHDLGDAETALGAKAADHGLSIHDSTMLDHAKKTINGGNDNLSPSTRIGMLDQLPKDVFDHHLSDDEQKAVLSQLVKAHTELDGVPVKNVAVLEVMDKATAKYEDLSGDPFPKTSSGPKMPTFGPGSHDATGLPPMPTFGAQPKPAHVQAAIDAANGFKAATDTKKLAMYHKLTPAETAALDPNTKHLMAANLEAMHKKFLDPKKKAHVLDVLNKVQVAQGGGAGAGGSTVHTPTSATITAEHQAKAEKGAMAAFMHGATTAAPGTEGHETLKTALGAMHATPDQATANQVFHNMAEKTAKDSLVKAGVPHSVGVGHTVLPHLTSELEDAFKGGSKPTPLADALSESHDSNDIQPLIDAVHAHPHLGPGALGVNHATPVQAADVAHALASHAGGKPPSEQQYLDKVSSLGSEEYHHELANTWGHAKAADSVDKLGLVPSEKGNLYDELGGSLADELSKGYKDSLDQGNDHPSGLAAKIDEITANVNQAGDDLAKKNNWPQDGHAVSGYKAALFAAQVKYAMAGDPAAGAGGSSTHVNPAAPIIHSTPAPGSSYTAPSLNKNSKGVISLNHTQKMKVVKIMKSFPEGQYLESPEPKIWDNLVAISAHEGVTPMQALTTLDEQNAKKLGLENKKLLEAKVRAWLATPDGKAYADANHAPKPHLLDHIKQHDAAHVAFSNNTGIKLEPGEKVQKIGGPGPFDGDKPASEFGKHDIATAEADQTKLKKELGIQFTPKQKAALREYVEGSGNINGWLRDEHTPSQASIDNAIHLQSMMLPTTRDHLLLRGTGWTQFPPEARSFEGLQKLVGETLEEPAFLSASVSKSSSGFGGAVKMHIEAPKGTMGVFTKDDQFPHGVVPSFLNNEAELLLAAKTELKVLKVWKEGGQVQVLMRVVS